MFTEQLVTQRASELLQARQSRTQVAHFSKRFSDMTIADGGDIPMARIEQLDRHTRAMRKVFDTIADNATNAGIITGGRPVRPDAHYGPRGSIAFRFT